MTGIVVVSHSAKLAEGVVELARGMVGAAFPIVAAGGLADQPDVLGTDAMRVLQGIEQVYDDGGVLVLVDLGSAILSAELALDFLAPEQRPQVRLCPAPLVEGAVAAVIAAQGGAALDAVFAAARAGLDAKMQQLGGTPEPSPASPAPLAPAPAAPPEQTITLTVPNRLGLHARPAARLVAIAGRFNAPVTLRSLTNGRSASARSFNGLMLLGALGGHLLEVTASGADAEQALAALQAFAAANFGDPPDADRPAPLAAAPAPAQAGKREEQNRLRGLPAAPGIAIGKAALYRPVLPPIPSAPSGSADDEIAGFRSAVERARTQIEAQQAQTERQLGADAAGIFAAHLAFLADADLIASTQRLIAGEHYSAAAAWKRTTDDLIVQYRQLESDYQQARAADVEAVQAQVLSALLGTGTAPSLREPAILVARDLTPAEIGALDAGMVLGILTADGSPTSHAAILARTLGLPMVVGLGDAILSAADGIRLVADGETGEIVLEPDADTENAFARLASAFRVRQEKALRQSVLPARTADGQRVEVVANIGSKADAKRALELGAEGVGVLRTEFLFMGRSTAPGADEQYASYRAIAEEMGGRPLVIRTLDAGGDKPLPYLNQRHENNPFLGLRAVRLCLANPDFFRAQLEAIVRVADEFPVRVMFPMIAMLEEFRAAKALLDAVQSATGRPAHPIRTGMMVEIPAAVECAGQFAPEVDFFSIGTNDLTQYAFAAERGNPQLAHLADALHPAILRLIGRVVAAGHAYGRPVAVCGEMASDPAAIPVLVGLGVDELSMNAASIPQAKAIIRQIRHVDAVELAKEALEQANAENVRRLVNLTP